MTATDVEVDLLKGPLADRVKALGLERNAAELALQGYTVVENAAPETFIDRLRDRIIELIEEQRAAGTAAKVGATFEESAWMLLGRGRVFEEAVCNPKLVVLNELMLGKGNRIGVCGGTLKRGGSPPMPLHTDMYDIREPYPQQCEVLTSLWTLDEWSEAGGATRIVPGSFKLRRGPKAGEGEPPSDDGNAAVAYADTSKAGLAVPIECPKGSIVLWDGASWHGNCARTLDGDRLSFHTPHKHFSRRSLESYDDIPEEIVERNPPIFKRIIGREAPHGKQTPTSPPVAELARMWEWMSTPSYP